MRPREFLETIVRPNVGDFHADFADLRRAYNAISAVDALAAHLYVWATTNAPLVVASIKDDTHYRANLAARNPEFALLRDIAKAQKHVHLTQGNPQVTRAEQVTSRATGLGQGRLGEDRLSATAQVVVDIAPDNFSYVESIIDDSLAFLEAEMAVLGA